MNKPTDNGPDSCAAAGDGVEAREGHSEVRARAKTGRMRTGSSLKSWGQGVAGRGRSGGRGLGVAESLPALLEKQEAALCSSVSSSLPLPCLSCFNGCVRKQRTTKQS